MLEAKSRHKKEKKTKTIPANIKKQKESPNVIVGELHFLYMNN